LLAKIVQGHRTMANRHFFAVLFLLVGLAGCLYLSISLFVPSSRRLIFGVDKHSGKVRLVENSIILRSPSQASSRHRGWGMM
jgi:hypothetical protein